MKLIAFGASSSRNSINARLALWAADLFKTLNPEPVVVETIDLNNYLMPIYSIDVQNENGIPEPANRLFAQFGQADAMIISYAEHNGFYTAAWKNIFDWMSRIEQRVFQEKPMVILSTSPGGRGGASVLEAALNSAPHFGADVRGSVSIPRWPEAFDEAENTLSRTHDLEAVTEALNQLIPEIDKAREQ